MFDNIKDLFEHYVTDRIVTFINCIKRIPIIWKDNNYDFYSIYILLYFKSSDLIEGLSNSVVSSNTSELKDLRLFNKLCERVKDEYYVNEATSYFEYGNMFIDSVNHEDNDYVQLVKGLNTNFKINNLDLYYKKYNKTYQQMKKLYPFYTDENIWILIADHNHQKAKRIMFKLLNERIEHWWD